MLIFLVFLFSIFTSVVDAGDRSLIKSIFVEKNKNDYSKLFKKIEPLSTDFPPFNDSGIILYVGGNGNNNYSKIKDAIENSSNGDTIYVYNGTYRENLVINKRIKLEGQNKNQVIIDGKKITDTIHVTVEGMILSNVTIKNSGNFDAGIKITTNYNQIQHCNIIENWDGIELDTANQNQISSCYISYNNWSGLYFYRSHNNTIDRCQIQDNIDGILLVDSNSNIVKNCRVASNICEGIELEHFSNKNIFYFNEIEANGGCGFFIYWGSNDTYISHCVITKNFGGIEIGSIFLGGGKNTTILANAIKDNVGSGIVFLGNGDFFKNTHIHFNNIYNNSKGISAMAAHNCFVYIQNNWWGSRFGPSLFGIGRNGDSINWNPLKNSRLYFYPWLKDQESTEKSEYVDILSNYERDLTNNFDSIEPTISPKTYVSSQSTLHVGGNGPGNYSKIQDAIDNSSNGDTIFIHNGTYLEKLVIDKVLRLIGENANHVVINAMKTRNTITILVDNVIIDNLTIINSGNFDAGIKINANYCKIKNCKIENCWDGIELNLGEYNQINNCKISNNQNEGIYLLNSHYTKILNCQLSRNLDSIWLDSSNNNFVKNCSIEKNQEEGIQLKGSSYNEFVSCYISSNTVSYGMHFSYNSNDNEVYKCVISENGVGIFFLAGLDGGLSGNSISFCSIAKNSGTGIFFLEEESWINDTHIHFNNIYGNKRSISLTNANNCYIYAQYNWWGSKLRPRLIGGNRIEFNPFNDNIHLYPWLKIPVNT